MKVGITKLNELQRMLLLSAIIGVVLLLVSIVGFFFNQPGWFIGVLVGTLVELANVVLLYKGSENVLSQTKALTFLLYFSLRMLLVLASFILFAVLDFKLHIQAFRNAIWGELIGLGPMEIVVVLVTSLSNKKATQVKGEDK